MWPICGDPSKMTTIYYCKWDTVCSRDFSAQARYRRRTDSGDVCEDIKVACPC